MSATGSSDSIVTATAGVSAVAGSYEVTVEALAKLQELKVPVRLQRLLETLLILHPMILLMPVIKI